MARRALWFTLLAIPAMTLAAPAGYVLSLEGEWAIEGGPALVVGAEVAPGARLRVKDPHPFAAVQVVDAKAGTVLLSVRCDVPERCAQPVVVPAGSQAAPGGMAALLAKAVERLRRSPDRYVSTISRGGPGLIESVLELDGDRLALAPALAALPEGSYVGVLSRLDCVGTGCAAINLPAFAWDPAAPKTLQVDGASPGLYRLVIAADDRGVDVGPQAWVRIEAPGKAEEARRAFAPAVALAAQWSKEIDPAIRATFLRAALEATMSAGASGWL